MLVRQRQVDDGNAFLLLPSERRRAAGPSTPNSLQIKTFLRRKATLKSISAPTARALSSDDVVRGREDELAVGFYYTSNAFYFSASVVLYNNRFTMQLFLNSPLLGYGQACVSL